MVTEAQVWSALQNVTDPEYPLSIVELGMVYRVEVQDQQVHVDMTFTAMGCPAIDMIISDVQETLSKLAEVAQVHVHVVWSPAWTKDRITSKGREILRYYGVGV